MSASENYSSRVHENYIELLKPGRVRPIRTPEGFDEYRYKSMLSAIRGYYDETGTFPGPDAIAKRSGIPVDMVASMLDTDETVEYMERYGLRLQGEDSLTFEQEAVLVALSDPSAGSLASVLRGCGVPRAKFNAWMRQPAFAKARRAKAENALADAQDTFVEAVVRKGEVGDLNAVKLGLAMTGRYDPDMKAVQDARQIVLAVVESVIRHVEDPDVRLAIVSDVQSLAIGFSTANPEIEA